MCCVSVRVYSMPKRSFSLNYCRGRKTVMRFLPNTAADLEPVLALLERLTASKVHSNLCVLRMVSHHGLLGIGAQPCAPAVATTINQMNPDE